MIPSWVGFIIAGAAVAGVYRNDLVRGFYWLRVELKRLRSRFQLVDSFCKHCGRDVHDFHAPDHVWEQVDPYIRRGHVLCYDCFAEVCGRLGLPTVWELVALRPRRVATLELRIDGLPVFRDACETMVKALASAETGDAPAATAALQGFIDRLTLWQEEQGKR
jgi:hypothetical protein